MRVRARSFFLHHFRAKRLFSADAFYFNEATFLLYERQDSTLDVLFEEAEVYFGDLAVKAINNAPTYF